MSVLQITWFILLLVLLAIYAILDGFDLGVGFWHLFTKKEEERHVLISLVSPFWDANEVWLLAAVGVLFAAFPAAYAAILSRFYIPIMIVLFAFILRGIAVAFRNKIASNAWSNLFDYAFAIGSVLPAFFFGIIIGNLLCGITLDQKLIISGNMASLVNPYSILVGILTLFLFATHGASYITMRTNGDMYLKARNRLSKITFCYLIFFIASFTTLFVNKQQFAANFIKHPILFILPITCILFIIAIIFSNKKSRTPFIYSSFSIICLTATLGASLFPNLVIESNDHLLNLTVLNASSSPLTQQVMLIIAIIGLPFVIAYQLWIYRLFGKKNF